MLSVSPGSLVSVAHLVREAHLVLSAPLAFEGAQPGRLVRRRAAEHCHRWLVYSFGGALLFCPLMGSTISVALLLKI